MAEASYTQNSFLGGEWSKFFQGRIDLPEYRTAMTVCFNCLPREEGANVRRAGTAHAGHTRGGAVGRVYRFDFEAAAPYTLEFVDGHIRFRAGTRLATTNDGATVSAISAANPAVMQTSTARTWATGDTVYFPPGVPLLENRQFTITRVDSTHFSLKDALTSANINGASLSAMPAGFTVSHVQDLASPYVGGQWKTLQGVQAETGMVLLAATEPPNILQATILPAGGIDAQFSVGALTFLDGPYLDPFTNGVQATPNATIGIVTITLNFAAYSSTKAYKTGDFVTSSSVNYISLIDQNLNNTPVSSPSAWSATSADKALNNGAGLLGTDVGRLVRFLSEPSPWAVGTAYVAGNIVSYNPTGAPGASTYWYVPSGGGSTGVIPGSNLTNWALCTANAAQWTWGKITSLTNQISQSLAGTTNIGDMTGGGGLAAAFDGVISQNSTAGAYVATTVSGTYAYSNYVGRNFSGASAQKIEHVTLYPLTDTGLFSSNNPGFTSSIIFNLRAKSTSPANASDGTLLATSGSIANGNPILAAPLTLVSSDQNTTWNYVWVEYAVTGIAGSAVTNNSGCAEMQLFNPNGTGTSNGFNVEILGPALLYTNPILTWRFGTYSATTGYPTCGCYHEGRVWLGGAVANRFDASVSNGLIGTTVNFAPTDQNGQVGAANAISYTVNSDGVNPFTWMIPDLQGIIAGTLAGEWLIQPPTAGAMSATNIAARRVTRIGVAAIEPRRTEHTLAFVQRYARKVMEYFADVYSGKFSAPNLSERAMHITKPLVAELAYTQAVVPVLWGRNQDGSWWGCTYKRDTLSTSTGPTFKGFHRHALGSGRSVVSITSGPSTGGTLDALTMVTLDSSSGIYHVEVLTDALDEGSTLAQAAYLDDAIAATSTSTTNAASGGAPYGGLTVNGLWPHNGKTVQFWCGGLDCGQGENGVISDFVVSNGSIFVPYGDGVSAGSGQGLFTAAYAAGVPLSQMLAGFTFTSQGQLVRPATPQESGARNGPALGKKRRTHAYAVLLEGSNGGSIGTNFANLDAVRLRSTSDVPIGVTGQFSGVWSDVLTDQDSKGTGYDSQLAWQVTRPYIWNVVQIGGFLRTEDK